MRIKNGRDVSILAVTAENYVVPKGEEHLYHVKQEIPEFDRKTGERLTRPCVQKYGRKAFEASIYDDLKHQGYTLEILHDPTEYLAAKEEAAASRERNRAKARAEAREAEKAALKAEIMAELAASGVLASPVDDADKKSKNKIVK